MPVWKPRIGLGLQLAWGTPVVAGSGIPVGGPIGLATTNLPDLNPNVELIDSPKHHGEPVTIYRDEGPTEVQVGPKTAGTTIEFDVSPVNVAPFLMSICQDLTVQGLGAQHNKKIYNYDRTTDIDFVYTDTVASLAGTPPIMMSVIRDMTIDDPALATESLRLQSAIVRTLTLSGARGEPIKASAELVAKSLETDYALTTDAFTLPVDNATPLLFQDTTFTFLDIKADPTGSFAATDLIAFSAQFTNNVETQHYDSQDIGNLVLGRFEVTGSITVPWRDNDWLDDFLAAAPIGMKWTWGTLGTAPSFQIYLVVVFTGETTAGDAEVELELPFRGVAYTHDTAGEETYFPADNAAVEFQVADALSYTIV